MNTYNVELTDGDCPESHYTGIAVYNQSCGGCAGTRCYPDQRQNDPCGLPHGDVTIYTLDEIPALLPALRASKDAYHWKLARTLAAAADIAEED